MTVKRLRPILSFQKTQDRLDKERRRQYEERSRQAKKREQWLDEIMKEHSAIMKKVIAAVPPDLLDDWRNLYGDPRDDEPINLQLYDPDQQRS